MNDREAEGRAELVAEFARLEAENARLRSLLGLDDRSADGHATAWSQMLLPEAVSSAPVDSRRLVTRRWFALGLQTEALRECERRQENPIETEWVWARTTAEVAGGGWARRRVRQAARTLQSVQSVRMGVVTIGHGDNVVTLRDAVFNEGDEYAGGTFVVALRGDGLAVVRRVFVFSWSGLDTFFEELAGLWRGWEGTKTWESPEDELTVEAQSEGGGHDALRFAVRNGPMHTWEASIDVTVDAGEDMTTVARDLADLLLVARS